MRERERERERSSSLADLTAMQALDLATSSHTERLTARFQTLAATRNLSAASFLVQLFDAIAVLLAELPLGTPRSRIKQLLLIEVRVASSLSLSRPRLTAPSDPLATLLSRCQES